MAIVMRSHDAATRVARRIVLDWYDGAYGNPTVPYTLDPVVLQDAIATALRATAAGIPEPHGLAIARSAQTTERAQAETRRVRRTTQEYRAPSAVKRSVMAVVILLCFLLTALAAGVAVAALFMRP